MTSSAHVQLLSVSPTHSFSHPSFLLSGRTDIQEGKLPNGLRVLVNGSTLEYGNHVRKERSSQALRFLL